MPAVTTTRVATAALERFPARAKINFNLSAMPMTTSHMVTLAVKWCSMWGVKGMASTRQTPFGG